MNLVTVSYVGLATLLAVSLGYLLPQVVTISVATVAEEEGLKVTEDSTPGRLLIIAIGVLLCLSAALAAPKYGLMGEGCLIVFGGFMAAGAAIDWATKIIPDLFSVWLMAIGLILSLLVPSLHGQSSGDFRMDLIHSGGIALKGMVVGVGVMTLIAIAMEKLTAKECPLGFGDVKLVGAIGAFTGWHGAIFALYFGAVIQACVIAVKAWSNRAGGTEKKCWRDVLPFGPAIAAAAWAYVLLTPCAFDRFFDAHAVLFS
jgi:prepilin signal peptidase PulO-like enzyme (type II secretory pathway)